MIFPNIKSFPIYWENGMKLSADHFQHLEDSIEDANQDIRALALMSIQGFGLIPYSPFGIQNAQGASPQSVRVILNACRAMLPGGYRVEILPENVQNIQVPAHAPFVEFLPNPGMRYHLYLTVGEQKRIPAGVPQTRPIRHPYLCHDYQLECIPQDRISAVKNLAPNRMKIAEWQDGKLIDGYIPPLLAINGFPLMEKWFQFLQNQLENIVRVSVLVINEHRKRDVHRADFCIPIVNYIRSSQPYFKWMLPSQAPISLAVYFGNLASLVEGLIESSDRDFIRNQLNNGQINNLRPSVHELLKSRTIPQEEMALVIASIQRFTSSLISTLQGLITNKPPAPRSGERVVSSG